MAISIRRARAGDRCTRGRWHARWRRPTSPLRRLDTQPKHADWRRRLAAEPYRRTDDRNCGPKLVRTARASRARTPAGRASARSCSSAR